MLSCVPEATRATKRRSACAAILALGVALSAISNGVDEIAQTFFKEQAGLDQHLSNVAGSLSLVVNYGAAFIGGLLADSLVGNFGSIMVASTPLLLGICMLVAASVVLPSMSLTVATDLLQISSSVATGGRALGLISFFLALAGCGGMRPGLATLLGDQFGNTRALQRSSFFAHLYLAFQVGSLSVSISFPLLRQVGWEKPWVVFAIAVAVIEWPLAVFLSCRQTFVHVKPLRTTILEVMQPCNCCTSRGGIYRTGTMRGRELLRVILVILPLSFFWAVYYQNSTTWVQQAERMDRKLGSWTMPAREVAALKNVFGVILIPLTYFVAMPFIRRRYALHVPLVTRMALGFVFATAATLVAGIVQLVSQQNVISVFCILPQYLLLSISEVLLAVSAYDFAYSQSPPNTRCLAISVWLVTVALGEGLTALVNLLPVKDAVLSFAWAGITALVGIAFPFVTRWTAAAGQPHPSREERDLNPDE